MRKLNLWENEETRDDDDAISNCKDRKQKAERKKKKEKEKVWYELLLSADGNGGDHVAN